MVGISISVLVVIKKKKFNNLKKKRIIKVSRIIMQKLLYDVVVSLHVSTKREKIILKKIEGYLVGYKDQYALFNIWRMSHTLQKVLNFTQNITHTRKIVLVNTLKKNYKPFSTKNLQKLKKKTINKKRFQKVLFLFSINKWVGGTLTNFRKTYQRFLYYKQLSVPLETRHTRQNKIIYKHLIYKKKPRLPHFLFSLRENHWAVNEAKLLAIKVAQCSENDFRTYFVDFNLFFRQHKRGLSLITTLINNSINQANLAERIFYRRKFLKFFERKSRRKRQIIRIRKAILKTIAYYNKKKRIHN